MLQAQVFHVQNYVNRKWVSNLEFIFFIVIVTDLKLGMSLSGFYISEEDNIAP